jgi:hypothetical protein
VVENRLVFFVAFDNVFLVGGYEADVFLYLGENLGVVDVYVLEFGGEYVAEHAYDAAFLFKDELGHGAASGVLKGVGPAFEEGFELVVEFGHGFAFGRCAHDYAEVFGAYRFDEVAQA